MLLQFLSYGQTRLRIIQIGVTTSKLEHTSTALVQGQVFREEI